MIPRGKGSTVFRPLEVFLLFFAAGAAPDSAGHMDGLRHRRLVDAVLQAALRIGVDAVGDVVYEN